MNNKESVDNTTLDATAIDKIDSFLKPKKRAAVFSTLSNCSECSQRDLASAIGSSVTALSNILVVFQSFEYQLIEYSNVGKYRYYKLSEIGEVYHKIKIDSPAIGDNEVNADEEKLTSEAKAALEEFKSFSVYDWEIIMSRLLEKRIYGREIRDIKRRLGLEAEDYIKAEQALDRYIACIEQAELMNDNAILDQMLGFIQNIILRDLIANIVDVFSQLAPIIRFLDDEKMSFKSYQIVKNAFSTQNDEEVVNCTNSLGWSKEEFDSLREMADALKENVEYLDEQGIYRYFLSLLPGRLSLCAYIARCICSSNK